MLRDHHDSLNGEPSAAVVKEILERRAEQVDDEDVVQTFLSEVVYIGDTGAADENLVGSVLISKLRCIALSRFEFDGHLLIVQQIGTLENNTKGTLSDLLADPVVDADDVGRA